MESEDGDLAALMEEVHHALDLSEVIHIRERERQTQRQRQRQRERERERDTQRQRQRERESYREGKNGGLTHVKVVFSRIIQHLQG